MDLTNQNFLTTLLDAFKTQCDAGTAAIQTEAMAVILFLGIIEIALGALLNIDQDHLKTFAIKIIKIAFFVWLVQNWTSGLDLCDQVFKSLQMVGVKAAGQTLGHTDPAAIGNTGIHVIGLLLKNIISSGTAAKAVMGNLGIIILNIFLMLVLVFCIFFMAIQLFLTTVEFYILSAISLILVPFGVNKHLAFISEKAIGAVFSLSIKVMVLEFILCISVPIMEKWGQISAAGDPATVLHAILGAAAMAFLAWQAPGLAASLLSGSPSLSAGAAIGGAASVASMATGGAGAAMRGAGAAFQATRLTNGSQGIGSTMRNLGTAALHSTSFSKGRQNMKSLIQNASQMGSNNTDYDAFKSPKK